MSLVVLWVPSFLFLSSLYHLRFSLRGLFSGPRSLLSSHLFQSPYRFCSPPLSRPPLVMPVLFDRAPSLSPLSAGYALPAPTATRTSHTPVMPRCVVYRASRRPTSPSTRVYFVPFFPFFLFLVVRIRFQSFRSSFCGHASPIRQRSSSSEYARGHSAPLPFSSSAVSFSGSSSRFRFDIALGLRFRPSLPPVTVVILIDLRAYARFFAPLRPLLLFSFLLFGMNTYNLVHLILTAASLARSRPFPVMTYATHPRLLGHGNSPFRLSPSFVFRRFPMHLCLFVPAVRTFPSVPSFRASRVCLFACHPFLCLHRVLTLRHAAAPSTFAVRTFPARGLRLPASRRCGCAPFFCGLVYSALQR